MALDRLHALSRNAVFEPDRGMDGDAPAPLRSQIREIPARVNGQRLFMATDEHGELVALGVMEPGGNKRMLVAGMYAAMADSGEVRRLQIV